MAKWLHGNIESIRTLHQSAKGRSIYGGRHYLQPDGSLSDGARRVSAPRFYVHLNFYEAVRLVNDRMENDADSRKAVEILIASLGIAFAPASVVGLGLALAPGQTSSALSPNYTDYTASSIQPVFAFLVKEFGEGVVSPPSTFESMNLPGEYQKDPALEQSYMEGSPRGEGIPVAVTADARPPVSTPDDREHPLLPPPQTQMKDACAGAIVQPAPSPPSLIVITEPLIITADPPRPEDAATHPSPDDSSSDGAHLLRELGDHLDHDLAGGDTDAGLANEHTSDAPGALPSHTDGLNLLRELGDHLDHDLAGGDTDAGLANEHTSDAPGALPSHTDGLNLLRELGDLLDGSWQPGHSDATMPHTSTDASTAHVGGSVQSDAHQEPPQAAEAPSPVPAE